MPSKKSTRRSISVKGITYARIVKAIELGVLETSASDYVEQLIDSDMRARGVPLQDKPAVTKRMAARLLKDRDLEEMRRRAFG